MLLYTPHLMTKPLLIQVPLVLFGKRVLIVMTMGILWLWSLRREEALGYPLTKLKILQTLMMLIVMLRVRII
jgi:hypothetical protein